MVEPAPVTDAGLAELERAMSAVPSPGLWLPWQLSRFDTSRITGSDGALMAEIYWGPAAPVILAAVNSAPSLVHRLRTAEADRDEFLKCVVYLGRQLRESPKSVWRDVLISVSVAEAAESIDAQIAEAEDRAEKAEAEVARLRSDVATAWRAVGECDGIEIVTMGDHEAEIWNRLCRLLDPLVNAASRAAPAGQSSAQPAAERADDGDQ